MDIFYVARRIKTDMEVVNELSQNSIYFRF